MKPNRIFTVKEETRGVFSVNAIGFKQNLPLGQMAKQIGCDEQELTFRVERSRKRGNGAMVHVIVRPDGKHTYA